MSMDDLFNDSVTIPRPSSMAASGGGPQSRYTYPMMYSVLISTTFCFHNRIIELSGDSPCCRDGGRRSYGFGRRGGSGSGDEGRGESTVATPPATTPPTSNVGIDGGEAAGRAAR